MTADSLAAFLLRMYDEIAALALSVAAPGRPLEQGRYLEWNAAGVAIGDRSGSVVAYSVQMTAAREHIARHDPAYVLADIAAKRRIVEQALGMAACFAATEREDLGADRILRLLAQPFAAHPDFRPEWKQ